LPQVLNGSLLSYFCQMKTFDSWTLICITSCVNPMKTCKVIGSRSWSIISLTFLVGWTRSIANLKALCATFNLHYFMCKSKANLQIWIQQELTKWLAVEVKKVNHVKPSDLSYQVAHLFSTFRRFHLKKQQRTIKDALHCNLVSKLDKGEKIDPQNLTISRSPVSTTPLKDYLFLCLHSTDWDKQGL
jgi:hypothetical protein